MRESIARFFKQGYFALVFTVLLMSCSSMSVIDPATEKPITDMKIIAGTWLSVGQWVQQGYLPVAVFATIYFQEDGSVLLYSKSNFINSGPWYYKGQLHNGSLRTANGEYTLYEHDGKKEIVYQGYDGYYTARLEPVNDGKSSPFEDTKKFKPFHFMLFPLSLKSGSSNGFRNL